MESKQRTSKAQCNHRNPKMYVLSTVINVLLSTTQPKHQHGIVSIHGFEEVEFIEYLERCVALG